MMKQNEKSHLLQLLPDGSLYDFLPDLMALTLDYGEFFIAQKGEYLARQNHPIEHFYLPIDENVTLFLSVDQDEIPLGFLQRKRSLALKEILFDAPYPYNARCETATRVIKLKKDIFLKHLKKHPKVEYYLKLIVQSSGLRNFKLFLEERGLQRHHIIEIFNKIVLQDQTIKPLETIQNDSERLYFIKSGELEIEFLFGDVEYRKLKIFEGAFFGGESLLPPFKNSYSAVAKKETTIHFASIKDIKSELERFNIIEELHDEPWVTKRAKTKEYDPWEGLLSPLFGEKISPEEMRKLDTVFFEDYGELARSDKHSFYLSIVKFAKIIDLDVNQVAMQNQIANLSFLSPIKIASLFEDYPAITHNTKINYRDIKDLNKPFLFIFMGRLHIFLEMNKNGKDAFIFDSAIGTIKVNVLDIFQQARDAIIIEKNSASLTRHGYDNFLQPLKNTKVIFIFIILLMMLTFFLNLSQPYMLQLIMDEALLLKDMNTLYAMGAGLLGILLFATFSNFLLHIFFREITIRYDSKLSSLFYKATLNKPLTFFRTNSTGDILSRFYELENIRNMISIDSLQALIDISSIVIYSLILFAYDVRLASLPTLFLVFVFGLQFFYFKRLKRNNVQAFDLVSTRNRLVSEILKSILNLKFARAQTHLKEKWEGSLVSFLKLKRTILNENAILNFIIEYGANAIRIATIWTAVSIAIEGEISTGAILAITIYINKITEPILSLNNFFINAQRTSLAFEKVGEVIQDQFQQKDKAANHYVPLKGKIRLERIFYRYRENTPWTIENLSLTIYPGQRLAIIGPSGCGKTTLAKIIAGLIEPNSGRIFYDDYDSSFLTKACVHNQISLVEQQSKLFSGTLLENIVINDSIFDPDNYSLALKVADAIDVAKTIQEKENNQILAGGRSLSIGQRQKISIARAIYKKPCILAMDEMTSSLDPFSERKIFDEIRSHFSGITQIIISHKKSAIQNADLIIVMDKGKIVEQGTHEDLIRNDGLYTRLFN